MMDLEMPQMLCARSWKAARKTVAFALAARDTTSTPGNRCKCLMDARLRNIAPNTTINQRRPTFLQPLSPILIWEPLPQIEIVQLVTVLAAFATAAMAMVL